MISVIIPTYNRAELLPEAIESVLSQPLDDLEVIVVDDGSTDDTEAVVHGYDGRVRYLSQDNAGVSAARNRGIREAEGEFILFLDSDDYLLPSSLELLSSALTADQTSDVVFSDGFIVGPVGQDLMRLSEYREPLDLSLDGFVFGQVSGLHTALFRRRALSLADGPFDVGMINGEDSDLLMRLFAAGARFTYVDVPTCAYRFHGANASLPNPQSAERKRRSLLRTRLKALDAPWYDELRPETHLRLFHDILTGPAVMDREAIERVLGHTRFAALPRGERSSLFYALAAERMSRESGWRGNSGYLGQAIRLKPSDLRLYVLLLLDLLPVPWRRALIARWRRLRSGPPVEDPIMAALRRGATPS